MDPSASASRPVDGILCSWGPVVAADPASVAPSSWLVQHDVEEGRQHLNFSEWNDGGRPRELDELWEVLENGEMPPAVYILQHPEADLTPAQVEQLISGLQATVRN